jgi:hypothetical protein
LSAKWALKNYIMHHSTPRCPPSRPRSSRTRCRRPRRPARGGGSSPRRRSRAARAAPTAGTAAAPPLSLCRRGAARPSPVGEREVCFLGGIFAPSLDFSLAHFLPIKWTGQRVPANYG